MRAATERGWGAGAEGSLGPELLAELAGEAEALGYTSFWSNLIGPGRRPGELLAALAEATAKIVVGIGVVPLDAYPALPRELRGRGLAGERLHLGVGSGALRRGQLELVRHGIESVREAVPGIGVAVGARRPKMLALAAERADAIVLSMVGPAESGAMLGRVGAVAAAAGREPARIYAYHRAAVGPGAAGRIGAEMVSHGAWPEGSAPPAPDELLGTIAEDAVTLETAVAEYPQAVDVVLRAVPERPEDGDEQRELLRRYAPSNRR